MVPATYRVSPCFETAGSILSDSSTMSPQFIDSDAHTDEKNSSRTIVFRGIQIAVFECLEGAIFRVAKEIILAFAVDFW